MNYVGDFSPGETVQIWYNTFNSADPSASVTTTNLADTDIHIYKDDGLTQRTNAAGTAVDIDVDTYVGVHKLTIDTADNTVTDFYEAGHDYAVVVEGTTVYAATVNACVGTFSIANRRVAGEMCHSSIEAYTDTTNFTLTTGEASANNDAYNGCTIIVTDQVTRIQKGIGHISDYVGTTRAIVLHAAPLCTAFTWAVGDSVEIFATSVFANVDTVGQTLQTANDNGGDINAILADTNELQQDDIPSLISTAQADLDTITGTAGVLIGTDAMDRSGTLDVNTKTITANAITATAVANGAIDNATFAADVGSTAYATNTIALACDKAGLNGVNAIQISGDSTAADNLELQYDGTGLIGDSFPATQASVAAVGGGLAIKTTMASVTVIQGSEQDLANAATSDDSRWTGDDDGAGAEFIFRCTPADTTNIPVEITFEGYYDEPTGATNGATLQVYNFNSASWNTIAAFTNASSDEKHEIPLSHAHKAPGGGTLETVAYTFGDVLIKFLQDTTETGNACILIDYMVGGYVGSPLTAAEIESECNDALVALNLDHLLKTVTAAADMTAEVVDNTILSRILANGDTSVFVPSTDGLQPIRDEIVLLDAVADAIKVVTDDQATASTTLVNGTVAATAGSTTEIYSDDITEATADHYNGRIIIFTSGDMKNQATDITDYALVGGEGYFTVTATTETAAENVTFVIV